NLLNPDAFIVEQNIQRYLATGKLDSDYVLSLSADAMPPLMAHLDQLQTYERIKIGGVLRFQKDALYAELSSAPWPSYHWGRKQAVDALTAQQDTLNQYPAVRPSRRPVN
ncbi:MAG: DUF4173 domain-containing protein, partial [Chloroflexi bacterium]|nr:DUF4173 domain-containing protein [Chloroflexota bacterium]